MDVKVLYRSEHKQAGTSDDQWEFSSEYTLREPAEQHHEENTEYWNSLGYETRLVKVIELVEDITYD